MGSHFPDHTLLYVCPVDGTFWWDNHTGGGKTCKDIPREEMKWLMRDITDRDKQLSIASDLMDMTSGALHQSHSSGRSACCYLLYPPMASNKGWFAFQNF